MTICETRVVDNITVFKGFIEPRLLLVKTHPEAAEGEKTHLQRDFMCLLAAVSYAH